MSTGDEDRPAPPRWSWLELVLLFLFGVSVPGVMVQALQRGGVYHALYEAGAVEAARAPNRLHLQLGGGLALLGAPLQVGGVVAFEAFEAKAKAARMRLYLWALALAWPLQVGGVLLLLYHACRATPAEAGLHAGDLGLQVWLALKWAVVLVPAVYVVQALVVWAMTALGGKVVQHDFTRLAAEGLSPAEWGLLAFAAVFVAPVWEELFFRGLVQRWVVATGPMAEALALGVALFAAVVAKVEELQKPGTARDVVLALLPAACVTALIGVWRLLPRERNELPGIFATAVLFAFVHTSAWPSPLPLLLLAIGLGYLAHRTRGIVGAVVLHAVFNAVAFALLMLVTLRG